MKGLCIFGIVCDVVRLLRYGTIHAIYIYIYVPYIIVCSV